MPQNTTSVMSAFEIDVTTRIHIGKGVLVSKKLRAWSDVSPTFVPSAKKSHRKRPTIRLSLYVGLELPDLQFLILFGSAAHGHVRQASDVDVAVQCDQAADLDALFMAVAPRLKSSRLDLVDLRRAGPLLAFEVARSGRVVF